MGKAGANLPGFPIIKVGTFYNPVGGTDLAVYVETSKCNHLENIMKCDSNFGGGNNFLRQHFWLGKKFLGQHLLGG